MKKAAPSKSQAPQPTIEIPDELKSKVNIAAQLARANQPAEALASYSEILTAAPNLFTIAVERGKLYQQTKDHTKAIADFTAAISFRPMEYFEAYFRRCISYYETGDYAKSVPDCSKAIEINPGPAEYYYYRGLAYTGLRTWEKAAADLASSNERNNDNADVHLQLARIYFGKSTSLLEPCASTPLESRSGRVSSRPTKAGRSSKPRLVTQSDLKTT